jgi:hypothetical protein
MMSIDWRMLELRHGDATGAIHFDGVFPTPTEKVAGHGSSLLRVCQAPLDVALAGAALEAKALLVAIHGDFPLATERAAKVLLPTGSDLIEDVLPNHRRFFVHRVLPP